MPLQRNSTNHPLILSKLRRPRTSGQPLIRPRLAQQLDAATGLVLVIAPAGYGKTTLLSTWLESEVLPNAWLSLGEDDNDLNVFVTYLVAAVHTLFPAACSDTLELLDGMTLPSLAIISQTLMAELAAIEHEFTLVLDDYHVIHESGIHALMTELTRHPAPTLRLVLSTRKDPPLPLSSLRARGDVIELREADLRFSLAETGSFLREEMKLQVDDQTVSDLEHSTEGWIAGLRLTALYVQHTGDLAKLAAGPEGYNHYIIDYLMAEVLTHVPHAIQDFLLKTSVLSRFCVPLCESVIGLAGPEGTSGECLEWLERHNLFLFSVDDDQRWFRYHHLFQKLLFEQLKQRVDRAEIDAMHAKASAWFAQNGYAEEALQHALAANDIRAAKQVFTRYRRELTNGEQWHRLDRWLRFFPREVIDQDPELLLSEVWFLINRQRLADLPPVLDRVEALLAQQRADPETTARLQGELGTRRATQFFYAGDYVRCLAVAQQSLTKIPTEWWMLRTQAWMFVGVASLATGNLKQAYDAVYDSGEADHGGAFQMRRYAGACFIHWMDADLFGLGQVTRLILQKSGIAGSQIETTTWARYHLGIVHYQRNNLADAEQALAPLIRQRYRTHAQCFLNGAAALALVYQAQGRPDAAREIAELMGAFALENHSNIVLIVAKAFQSELALRQGRLAEACFWADHTDIPLTLPMPFFYNPSLTYIRIRLAENTEHSRQQARQMLRELYIQHAATHNTVVVIQILALQALLDHAEGNASAARRAIQQAIGLAEPGGFIRTFVDLGEPLQQVLTAWVGEREPSPYEAKILAAFLQPSSPTVVRREANAALLSPLSPRELEVLALLEKRYTDMEIADTLVISQNTVRSHIRHIGEKLGVNGRRAIVDAAGVQDLL